MAGRVKAALGSLAFLVLAPGVVAGLVPWLITQWRPLPPGDGPGALRWTGLILIAAGLAVVLEAFARFAWEGLGTPAPVAPTRTLVVSGFYRFVRNPMYVAVTALIIGQAVLFASWGVALYGVVIAAAGTKPPTPATRIRPVSVPLPIRIASDPDPGSDRRPSRT